MQHLTPILAALLLVLTGCPSGSADPSDDDAGPGSDAGPPAPGTDAGPPAPGTDAGPAAFTMDWDACQIAAALALVNDEHTSAGMLRGVGLSWDTANALADGRPYRDGAALDRALGASGDDWALLVDAAADECALPDGEPALRVRFTDPRCAALDDPSVPAGVRCYGGDDEETDSLYAAGINDQLVRWIDLSRRAKEAAPGRDVRITMAYLTWSNWRVYAALCRATAAGVRLEGYFDAATAGSQPARLLADEDCAQENIDVRYLGGVTDFPDWRLMHVKMMLFESGGEVTRVVFGSANNSTYATTIHHESWVFARFPSDSHFALSHRCGAEALREDAYDARGEYADVFAETYAGCVDRIAAREDPRYRVFFTPDTGAVALDAAIALIESATARLDVAAQHLSEPRVVAALAAAGGDDTLASRLLLDDDTFYGARAEDEPDTDRAIYESRLRDSGLDIRFLQTHGSIGSGAQYQHNKVIVADGARVFTGAGNFTAVAFRDNYENFYVLDDPAVAAAFLGRVEELHGLGVRAADLPADPAY